MERTSDDAATRCPRCAHENRVDRRFCAECGAPLPRPCSGCGFANEPGAKFCGGCGDALASHDPRSGTASPRSYTPPHLAEKILNSASALAGERKQVTVHFVDISGFTSLSERLDPEDVHATMTRVFELLLEAVHRYEGTVNQFLGDGIMALFGAPVAHEDHAQRAVLAALAIRESLDAYQDEMRRSRGIGFQVRQGLNTGTVVVGSIGSDLRMDYTAVGDTTNVAARLEQAARPGEVVVSESTRRLVAEQFETRPLGALSLKGKALVVDAWEIVSRRSARSRLEIEFDRGLTPLAGREQELQHLLARFDEARRGEGRIAFVAGEAGIGKSRLLHELRLRIGDQATWLEGRCVSFGRSIAFHPLVDLLKRAFGIGDGDARETAADRVDRAVRRLGGGAADAIPYLCALLSIESRASGIADLDPQTRRGETLRALVRVIELSARERPLVLVVEDLHWADVATEDLLIGIADHLARQPVLIVLTHRIGYEHRLARRAHASRIDLGPLSAAANAAMADSLVAGRGLSEAQRSVIATRGDGNPFFIEELARARLEPDATRAAAATHGPSGNADEVGIPETVQDLIAARIDRLQDEPKRMLQVASVIGREFSRRTLCEVERGEHAEDHLRALEASQLIRLRGDPSEPGYTFNHALTQEVAYGSLLGSRRREIHRSTAEAIERLQAEHLAEYYEVLAHHYHEARVWEKALEYMLLGARKASAAFAQWEALALYERALDVTERLGDSAPPGTRTQIHSARCNLFFGVGEFARSRAEANALLDIARASENRPLTAAALALGAWAAVWMEDLDEGVTAATEAIRLGEETGFLRALGGGLLISGTVHAITGRHDEADADFARALAVSQEANDFDRQGQTRFFIGTLRNWRGRYAEGLQQAMEGARVAREHRLVVPLIRCLWAEGVSRAGLGDYQGSLSTLRDALSLAESSGDEAYLARVLNTLGWLHIDCQDFDTGLELSERGLALARSSRDATGPERAAFTLVNEGDAFLARNELERAAEALGEAHHIVRHPPQSRWMTWRYATHCYASLGELAFARGDLARATAFADQSLEIAVPTRSRKYESQAWRLKGRCALSSGRWDEAEAALSRALAIATDIAEPRQQWQTHAAFGELRRARGQASQAERSFRAAAGIVEALRSKVHDPGLAAGLARVQAGLRAD